MPEGTNTPQDTVRELTFGEKAVGLTFNPSQDVNVANIKQLSAQLIDLFNTLRAASTSPDVGRMLSIAITEAQSAQMWAVKAVTWKY